MKSLKLPILGLALVLFASSCKKSDVYEDTMNQNETVQVSDSVKKVSLSGWKTADNWESAKQDDYSVYYFNIEDSRITSEVASDGLVLVYKKNGESTVAMPYEDSTTSTYWYHQVTDGNLLILSEGASQPTAENSFNYIIITPDQLTNLEAQGHSRSNLMDMTYEQASELVNANN